LKLVICEDDQQQADILKKHLLSILPKNTITTFYNGSILLKFIREASDDIPSIIFLDIEMPGINGIETAKEIRQILPAVDIVFITGHPKFALDAFNVYAFDYILKPLSKERLENTLKLIISKQEKSEKFIFVKSRGMLFKVRQEDIYFIEKIYNKCIIYTKDFTYNTVTPLKTFFDELDPEMFINTHKAYIVNKYKIRGYTASGNQAYEVYFSGFDKTARLSRGMNKILNLI